MFKGVCDQKQKVQNEFPCNLRDGYILGRVGVVVWNCMVCGVSEEVIIHWVANLAK